MRKLMLATVATALSATAALAQVRQPFRNPANFQLGDYGRFHGYLSQPVFCGIAKCGDNWRVPGQANPQSNSHRARRRPGT
jgi:hypothetical protein